MNKIYTDEQLAGNNIKVTKSSLEDASFTTFNIYNNSKDKYMKTSLTQLLAVVFSAVLIFVSGTAMAQPTVLFTGLTSTTPAPSNSRYTLSTVGGFRQFRFQSNQAATVSTVGWAFHSGSTGSPNYSPSWRPLSGGNTLSLNNFIPTTFANGAKYSAGGTGTDGLLPAITSGNYYTFNVSANAAADNVMQLLETSFNPVTVSSVTQAAGSFGSNTVTITTSGTPNASENIFVRYSTNSYVSSTIVQATGSVTTWTATIPWQSSAVSFYVYTSSKTLAQINSDVISNGQGVHDMSTLNLNNNGGPNYSWTPAATNPDGGFESGASFAANGWIVVNNATNTWQVSGVSTPFAGSNAAFISNDGGTTYTYSIGSSQTSHFYRDITVPAGETKINLTFQWKGSGESGFDRLLVYTAPTSVTPVAGTPASSSTTLTGATLVFTQPSFAQATYTTATVTLPANFAGTTFRLIFTWQNDASGGVTPGASVDNISLTSTVPGTITSNAVTGNWSATSTWVGGAVPGIGDDVTIVNGATVTIDAAAANPSVGNLTVGGGTSGTLIYNATAAQTLSAVNVAVNAGATLSTAASGTITTHILDVSGNITNSGTIDLSTNANTAGATLRFSGSGNSTYSGTGATNDLFILLMNKAALAQVADINLTNFTVRGLSSAATGALLTTASGTGTVKFSGTNTFSGQLWSTGSYSVLSTMGIWLNNANFTVTGLAGSPTMSGLLRMTAGTYNVGTSTGNAMGGATTSTFIIEGGTMNFASRLNVTSSGASFNMSAGIINICTVANASATASFGFTSATSVFTMSGGTINLVQANTTSPNLAYFVNTTSPTITGGTVNVGTSATATNFTFGIQGAVPNLVVDNTTNNKTAIVTTGSVVAYGTTTINSGATLNLNGLTYQERAATFTNNGILTGTTTSSRLSFFSPTNAAQTFAGSGTVTAPLDGLSVQNTGGLTITHTNAFQTLRVNLFAGTITNSNKITLGSGGSSPVTVQIGSATSIQTGGSFDVAPTMNLGTGTYSVLYLQESSARTTGFEIPATRTVSSMTIGNSNNVTISGGNLSVSTLTLSGGQLISTSSNLVTVTGTTTTSVARASNYVSAAGATSSGTTVTVTTTAGLFIGMTVTVTAGTGAFAANTTVTNLTSTTFTISATPTTALSGGSSVVTGTSNSFINGPLSITLPASLVTGSTYTFPIGKGTYNPLELVNPTTTAGGTVVIKGEVFDANAGGSSGINMGALNTNRYWASTITSGSANFTNSFIKLTDASAATSSAIASSISQAGTYDIVGGTSPTIVVGTSVTSVAPAATGIPGFYVLGVKTVSMVYTSSTTTQTIFTPIIKPTITNQQIIGVQIVTTGNASPLTLSGINFNTTGSTNPATDIATARVWSTGTSSIFATGSQFGSDVAAPSGAFTVSGSQVLAEGTNYFWLVYDIQSTATVNNVVDAQCTSVNVGGAQTPSVTTVAGTRTIKSPLSGTYLIGAGQTNPNYIKLTDAIADLNTYGVSAAVVFSLTDASYPSETFPLTINSFTGASGTNTLTIKPASTVTAAISGSSASGLIVLNGADFVTIDGSNNGTATRNLTLTNTNTGTSSAVVWLQTATADGATNNTIKNLNLVGTTVTATAGTLIGAGSGSSTISISSIGTGNNTNTFQNNSITKTSYGIYSGGASAANKNTGTVISQNVMNTASPNNITIGGILANFESGIQITQNDISVLRHDGTTGTTGTAFGIALGIVPSNTVTTFTGSDVVGAIITRNKINGVTQLNSTGYSAFGIVVNSVTSGTTQIVNNMISGVRAGSTASDFSAGILAGGGTGSTTQIYFNSVSMTGTRSAATYPSYGLAINSGDPIVDVRNNIFYNTQTSTSTGKMYAIATGGTTFANLTSNYNDFFVSGTNAFIGQTGGLGTAGTDRSPLVGGTGWQVTTGKDANSISSDPLFTSTTDLHAQTTSPVNAKATPIAGITTDFDGDTRNVTTPDIGADEFAGCTPSTAATISVTGTNPICTGSSTNLQVAITGGTSPFTLIYNAVDINGTTPVTVNNYVSGTNIPVSPLINTTYSIVSVTSTVGSCAGTGNTGSPLVTVNQNATISLSSAIGTNRQSVCKNAPITDITYSIGGAGTAASITSGALPAGVTGTFNTGVFTITGTPSASGVFNYTITATGGSCTQQTASGTITVNAPPTATFTKTMVSSCGGGADGTITVTPTGNGPFTYSWTSTPAGFTGNTAQVTGLSPRDYTVVVTDNNLCSMSIPDITIFQVFATVVTNNGGGSSSCGNTGYILLYGSGGVQPYTYSIDGTNYFASNSFTGLAAGTYTGYVKDFGGCVSTKPNIVVTGAAAMVVTANTRPATSCANNGTIELYRTGGVAPYTYSLNGSTYQSGNTFNNLAGNTTYTGYVKDASGCITSLANITVGKAPAITVSSTVNNTSACSNTGRIQVLAGGGVPGYTYSITGANGTYQASNAFTGLAAGSYNVWVQDSKACKNVQFNVTVGTNAASTITVTAYARSASSCTNNGSIELYRTGGFSPFTYSLDNITYQASNTFTGLAGGTFTGWVKDANGCTGSLAGITITQAATVTVTEQHTNASCINDGTIQLTPGGGVPGYTYSLDNNTYQTGNSFSGLAAGSYTGWVKDSKGCTASVPVTIGTSASIVVTAYAAAATNCETSNGSIQLFRTGGTGPFTYSLDNITYQSSNTFTGKTAGTYTGYVKDSKDCVGSLANIFVGPNCAPPPIAVTGSNSKSNVLNISGNDILSVKAFPNPSTTEFTLVLKTNSMEKVVISVTDILGRNVYQSVSGYKNLYRFGSNLKPGMYSLLVMQGGQMQTIKLVKE